MNGELFELHPCMPKAHNAKEGRGSRWRRMASIRLNKMYRRFGMGPQQTKRKTCAHLQRHKGGHSWMKCSKSWVSGSDASDWRAGWAACGAYESKEQS